MVSLVITIVVIIILSAVVITNSSNSIYQASDTKIYQELAEVKKGVDAVRLTNAKTGKTDEETINKGFIKVRVENPPETFVSFDENQLTGYVVDLSVIDYEKLETGREYLTLAKGDVVTFDVDDVYLYDNAGKVYYAKGYQIGDGDLSYTADNDTRKDGPIVEIISTTGGVLKIKVTPIYGGEISSVMVGNKRATTTDGTNFEFPVNKNGSYKIIATEEGGNSTVKVVEIGEINENTYPLANLIDVHINNKEPFTSNRLATLHVNAENAAYMSISQYGLVVPSPTDLSKWRKYESEVSITLREGTNKVYVWCKNEGDVPTDYKMAEIILDTVPPTRDEPSYVMNDFEILVTCEQTDEISSDLAVEYGFKREHDTTYTWQESPIIVDADPGERYHLVTRATDEAGNTSESRATLTEPVMTIPDDIKMTANPAEGWTTRVQVTIEYADTYGVSAYKNLYRIDGGAWKEVTSNKMTMTVIKNCKIEACVSINVSGRAEKMGAIRVLNINNIDRVDPFIHDSEDIGPYRQDGFDIKAKVYDKESGLAAWTVTTTDEVPTNWDNVYENPTTETVQMSYRVEVNDIYYFWVKDAGNNMGRYPIEVTNIDLYDPIINSLDIAYGTGQATLTARAIDEELGINAYAFVKGQDVVPSESAWVSVDQTITECEWKTVVSENDYYSIWVRDVSGRTSHMQKYVRVKYTVTYNYTANKGDKVSVSGGKLIVGCNSNVDLSPTAERGYSSFVGWNTDQSAKVAISSLRVGDSTTNQEDITIYAIFKWEDIIYFSQTKPSNAFTKTWEAYLGISKHIPTSTLQYSYDNSSWSNYSSTLTITKNRTVYARTLMDGEVIKTNQINITNICESHVNSDATCTLESRCTICNKYNGAALGHDMGSWITTSSASCTSNGYRYKVCSRGCGHSEDETLYAYGHNYSCYSSTSGANCQSTGTNYYSCSNCGASYSESNSSYGNHTWYYRGNMDKICTTCGLH